MIFSLSEEKYADQVSFELFVESCIAALAFREGSSSLGVYGENCPRLTIISELENPQFNYNNSVVLSEDFIPYVKERWFKRSFTFGPHDVTILGGTSCGLKVFKFRIEDCEEKYSFIAM